MGPLEAIKTGFAKSFQFKGRASRSEFWWFAPIGVVIVAAVCISLRAIMQLDPTGTLFLILLAAAFSPLSSAAARRLGDVGASSLNLMMPISIAFAITMLIMSGSDHASTMNSLVYLLPLFAVCSCVLAIGFLLGWLSVFGIFSKMGETIGYLLLPSPEPVSDFNPNEVPQ